MKQFLLNKLLPGAIFVSLLFVLSPRLDAQASAGSISGVVTDASGASIPQAKVKITNQGTSVSSFETTDKSGFYSAEGLAVGLYRIEISKAGFKESVTNGIQIDPGQRRADNVVLQVGSTDAQVTVTANA